MNIFNWLVYKPWLFPVKILFLFILSITLFYFMGTEGITIFFGGMLVLELASYHKISPQEEI